MIWKWLSHWEVWLLIIIAPILIPKMVRILSKAQIAGWMDAFKHEIKKEKGEVHEKNNKEVRSESSRKQ